MAALKDTVTVVVDNCGGAHFKDMLDVLCVGGRYVGILWYRGYSGATLHGGTVTWGYSGVPWYRGTVVQIYNSVVCRYMMDDGS